MYVYIFVIFFGCWIILSIANQFSNKFIKSIKPFDAFHLIPSWKFFAPRPLVESYQIYFRDKTSSGEIGELTQIPTTSYRKLRHVIWNPERRTHKLFIDAVIRLLSMNEKYEETPELVQLSVPYLLLLNITIQAKHDPDAEYTQFVILTSDITDGFANDRLVMSSWFHKIDNKIR